MVTTRHESLIGNYTYDLGYGIAQAERYEGQGQPVSGEELADRAAHEAEYVKRMDAPDSVGVMAAMFVLGYQDGWSEPNAE